MKILFAHEERYICKCGNEQELPWGPENSVCKMCGRIGCWISEGEYRLEMQEDTHDPPNSA